MKEICIVLEKKLNLKYEKLIVKLKNFKCIVIKLNQQNDVKLVIAYNDTNSFEVENLIKNYLKDIVLKTFKQNFIKNNMKLSFIQKLKTLRIYLQITQIGLIGIMIISFIRFVTLKIKLIKMTER